MFLIQSNWISFSLSSFLLLYKFDIAESRSFSIPSLQIIFSMAVDAFEQSNPAAPASIDIARIAKKQILFIQGEILFLNFLIRFSIKYKFILIFQMMQL
ncbi:hypothetical protein DMW62_08125 [Serratia marcescens]|uniref:Uncharacterized protein n=1 Tax=Serratia marcescens TaxID=615 RepID=A0ABX5NFI7_SERMA|nr:hypothetical protein CW300_03260 [Serratia marcescens]PYA13108.1 hypothetical protein DMW42_19540 [Serratia marcescens]PYA22460.1 hypothetical protein DMW41_16395 [Serratia marcescens]PYA25277.1 hypothetical protein DMW40_19450 [Serratia marcescens]PYA37707.1 hypothetical protein DMW44_15625 [Serratia marcescens]